MKTFYFTATGNSLYVAKRIGGELYSIPQMLENKRLEFEDEAIGIVLPCYGWGIPNMVISARFAPFPPSNILSEAEPSAFPSPKK